MASFTRYDFGSASAGADARLRPPIVVTCDHASAAIPPELGDLGLDATDRSRHIAWDIGAGALTLSMARRLAARAVLANWSRLVVDCNRSPDDPTCIPVASDGVVIPGNARLTAADRARRIERYWRPYHAAIDAEIAACRAFVAAPVLVAVHSFTPVMQGQARPWSVGILWDKDTRIAQPLIAALRARPRLVVGDNQPYSGRHPADYTIDTHAEADGLPYASIEVRQDELQTAAAVEAWADLLVACLRPILADTRLYVPQLASVEARA